MQKPGGLQLLIAEDSTLVRERLVAIAREHLAANSICSVATGMDAVAVFDQSNPDAVLLDLGLPDMSGLEVLEHIRRSGAATEVIVFTNWASPEMAARCHLLGADHFISKAHDVGPVIELLKTITASRRERGALRTAADSSSQPAVKTPVEHRPASSHPVNLLVVEDDNSQAEPLLKLLRPKLPQGSSITRAASKAAALQCLQEARFEVALLDLGLPDSEGVDAVVALRAASPDLAIIVLSAQEDDGTVDAAVDAGADDYFIKGELAATAVARAVISAAKRKRAARALMIALASRQRIMDSSADVICTLDVAGRFVEMGAACERVWGYTREELIGRLSTEWIVAAEHGSSDRFLDTIRSGATASEFENAFVRRDGSRAEMRWTAVWSATDRLIYCVARDITQRKRNEETLRATIASALDCIISVDESNTVLEFNPAAEQTFRWTSQEALGRQLTDLIIPPEARAGHARTMAGLLEPGPSPLLGKRIEIMAMRSDGTEFPVELSLIRIGTERPARFTAFLRDISGRVTARAKLEAQEAQYRVLFESNPNAMWVYDLENLHILAVNDAAVAQYGYSREEFHGMPLAALRPAEERDRMVAAVRAEGRASGPAGTWRHLRKDGTGILVDVYSSPTTFEGQPARMAVLVDITEQKAAEEEIARHGQQLATERARLVTAQSVAKVGDWEVNFVTQTRTWSAETYRIFEVDADEAGASHERFMERVHPEDRAAVKAASAASLTQCSPAMVKHRMVMPDGRIKFIEQRWQVIYDENGKALHSTGTVQDITEREEAQEVLRRSERNLALAQRVSHTGSWEIDWDAAVAEADRDLHWSDEQFRMFGFAPGEVAATQQLFFELVHPEDRERVRAAFAACFESNAPYCIEHRITWPDGTEREILEQAEFLRDATTGAVVKIIGTAQDVTERNKAQRTLREQAEMLNLAHEAIVIRGAEDRVITFWNKGAEHLYGWTAAEAVGKSTDDILFRDQEHYEAVARESEANGYRGEVHQVAKDGRALIVNASATVIRNSDGTPRSVLIIQSDITEHKKLENQFLRAQRLESIGTLASGVAHDLNNVLAPILMSAPLLRDELTPAMRIQIVDTIEKSAERGAQIVKQVLTFARGVDGERVLLDPRHLIKEMAEIAEQTFPKTIQVTTRYTEDLALLEGDPTQLHQVLLNLAVNARDAMPTGGKLTLSAANFEVDEHYAAMTPGTKPGPHVLINVTDTGTGIPADVMEKMFDPFFTTKEIGKGTGLGLSTLLGIVKSHDGAVNAYSTPAGTTFRVLLPAAGASELGAIGAAPELLPGRGETILVVDDEPAIREVAQVLLEKNGYNVLVADDGPAALAIFAQRHGEIALVLTDFLMPIMDGVSLARILRKMDPAAKLIMSSGREDDCGAAELEAIGIAASLTKPYTKVTLLRTLQRVLNAEQALAA